jgi:hypothetical protein
MPKTADDLKAEVYIVTVTVSGPGGQEVTETVQCSGGQITGKAIECANKAAPPVERAWRQQMATAMSATAGARRARDAAYVAQAKSMGGPGAEPLPEVVPDGE